MTHTLTQEQREVIAAEVNILAVDAFAGTGKTSTLEAFATARPRARILYLAFNRSIASAAKERFPKNVDCRTTHSLAYGNVGKQFSEKLGNATAHEIGARMNCTVKRAKSALEAVSAWLCSVDDEINASHVVSDDDDPAYAAVIVDLAKQVWQDMSNPRSPVKMPHDGYLKLWVMSRPKLSYDYILLDEAQDTNPVTLELVLAQRKHAKLVLVGDRHQGIYSFRKAVNAMETAPADKRVAITRSFRFGEGIAAVATRLLQHYKDEQHAVTGRSDIQVKWTVDRRQPYTLLSRTNASLFGELARLVQGSRTVGGIHYVGGFEGYFFGKVLDAYHLWADARDAIRDQAVAKFPDFGTFRQYGEEANDVEVKALVKVVEQYTTRIPVIYNALRAAEVPDARAAVVVATAHKSKGLEWDQVVLTDDFVMVPPDEKSRDNPEKFREEVNLLYVAITRAIRAVELPASSRDWLLPEGIEQDNEPEVMPEPAAEQEPLNYYQAMERLQALVDANEAGMLPQPLVVTEARRAISFFHEVTGR